MRRKNLRNPIALALSKHADAHALKLLAYESVTSDTLGDARGLICDAARRLAKSYKPRSYDVDLAESSAGVVVIVSSLRNKAPKFCPACED